MAAFHDDNRQEVQTLVEAHETVCHKELCHVKTLAVRHRPRLRARPAKPYPSFPLTAHNNGQWCKKIRGKVHFFGVWGDAQDALDNYLRIATALHAGQMPRPTTLSPEGPTVKDVCNHYLTFQVNKAQARQILADSFNGCLVVVESFARYLTAPRSI